MNKQLQTVKVWAYEYRQDFYALGLIVLVCVVLFLVLTPIFNRNFDTTQAQARTETGQHGDELIFPAGWTPVDCEAGNNSGSTYYNDCRWVCVKDSVYRYCTPTIQPVTDDDPSRGY